MKGKGDAWFLFLFLIVIQLKLDIVIMYLESLSSSQMVLSFFLFKKHLP